jgi:hypothetical protein
MSGAPLTDCDIDFSVNQDMSNCIKITAEEDIKKAMETKEVFVGNLNYVTSYFFRLRIQNTVGWSPWSAVSPAFVTKACRPAHPEALAAIDVQKEAFSVSWQSPADHGAAVTEYELIMVDTNDCADLEKHVKEANDCNYVNGDDFMAEESNAAVWKVLSRIKLKSCVRLKVADAEDPNEPTHTFTELLGGIVYAAAVRAYNSEGWSDWSAMLTVQTPSAKPEQCPQLVLLEAKQKSLLVQYRVPYDNGAPLTELEFYWTRVLGPIDRHKARTLGGVAEDHRYKVERTINLDISSSGPERAPPHGIGGTGEILFEGLEPGTDYDTQVRVANRHDYGPASHIVRMQTAPGRPDAPEGVRHGYSDSSAGLDYEEPPTVCFGKTGRLQNSEVVHVREGKVKQAILDTLSPTTSPRSITNP